MEQSFVKLRIAEKEDRIRKDKERKTLQPSPNNRMSVQQKDGKYFLVRLDMEIQKINGLIDSAEKDGRLSQLPDEASGKIRNAIGKAQLLLSKRFKQFTSLCNDNIENNPDKKETKSSDLQGYWDMMYIQIEDVCSLFVDIKKMKENNWQSSNEIESVDGLKPNGTSTSPRKSPSSRSPTGKSPRPKNKNVDDDKVKREARSRLAAVRKQAKLRAQQEAANGSLNSSLNNSWTVGTSDDVTDTTNGSEPVNDSTTSNNTTVCNGEVEGEISLNSSFNTECSLTSSNSSSVELINDVTSNGNIEISKTNTFDTIPPVSIEVNGVA